MIKITNKTNKEKICTNCKIADDALSKIIGLMFNFKVDKSIFFIFDDEKKHPIHSYFVFQKFVAIYINGALQVVDIIHINPFQLYIVNKKPAKYLLECTKPNSIPKVGDEIKCWGGKF